MTVKFNPADFSVADVYSAYERIRPYVYQTPLEESLYLGQDGRRYFFKLECNQTVRSFKLRGALSVMTTLDETEKQRGVATISSGNHGCAVAYGAKLLGIENAVIIVPETAPAAKVDKIRFYGGKVLQKGKNYDEAHAFGMEYIAKQGLSYIDAYYDDHRLYGGQGTIALEVLEQNPDVDTIVVPIGGGGLITGIACAAKAVKPEVRVIGCQTEACPAMIRALKDRVFYEEYPVTGDTICDALVGGVGKLSYERLEEFVTDIVEVKEKTIRAATRFLLHDEKYIVEGGSATTVAAIMEHRERIGGKNIALILSGGNIDGSLMAELLRETE